MDPRLFLDGLFVVSTFFAALWIKGVRDELRGLKFELHEVVKRVNSHGERIAVLESQQRERTR